MKKKSIFVVALAALMLIAFTACEQAVPTFGGKELVRLGVEKVSDKDYLIGQEFDPSTIKVTAYFADGSSAIADSEKDLIFGYDFKDAGAKTVSISYQGSTGNQKTTSYMVTVYKPTELKIAGTPSVVTYYQDTVDTTADVSKTGVTVTAVYNGTKEMVLAEDEYTLTASVASVDDEVAVTAKFVADDTISKDAEFTVKVVAPTKTEITDVELPQKIVLYTDETTTVYPKITPVNADYYISEWSSDKPEVASVVQGFIAANQVGTCIITYTIQNNIETETQTITKEIFIEVKSPIATKTVYKINAPAVGYMLSTPILYLLTSIGTSVFFNEINNQDKMQSGTIAMVLNNSYSSSFPIVAQQAEIITRAPLNYTSNVYFWLVDANMREVKLLKPLYITIRVDP